jgi:hypothetical protein
MPVVATPLLHGLLNVSLPLWYQFTRKDLATHFNPKDHPKNPPAACRRQRHWERRAQGQARPARACRPGLAPRKVIFYHFSGPPRFGKHVMAVPDVGAPGRIHASQAHAIPGKGRFAVRGGVLLKKGR